MYVYALLLLKIQSERRHMRHLEKKADKYSGLLYNNYRFLYNRPIYESIDLFLKTIDSTRHYDSNSTQLL